MKDLHDYTTEELIQIGRTKVKEDRKQFILSVEVMASCIEIQMNEYKYKQSFQIDADKVTDAFKLFFGTDGYVKRVFLEYIKKEELSIHDLREIGVKEESLSTLERYWFELINLE